MAPVLSDFLLTPPSTIPAVSSVVITSVRQILPLDLLT
jgi:hypothetical protein